MAFTTIQGSGANDATSFVGSSGVDNIQIQNEASRVEVFAQAANDIVNVTNFTLLVSDYSVKGGQGNDTVNFTAVNNTSLNSSLVNGNKDADAITLAGVTSSTVYGGQGADTVTATATAFGSIINGNKDADILNINVGASSSSVFGGQGIDALNLAGTFTASVVQGDNDGDTIVFAAAASLGNSTVNGNAGNDTIIANGALTQSESTIFGGSGNDSINLALAANATIASGDLGTDSIAGGAGASTFYGGAGTDSITGGAGNETIFGGDDVDTLIAGTGTDTVNGGAGADAMTTAGGATRFTYAAGITGSQETGNVSTGTVDRLTGFATTADTIQGLGVAGTAAAEFTGVAGTTGNTYAQALAAANVVFAAANAQSYFMTSFGTDGASAQGVLFVNMNNDAIADGAILIGAANAATNQANATALLVAGDILA